MADIELTDDLGESTPGMEIDSSIPSSLIKYAKTELLSLKVAPDFTVRALQRLATAAPNPISFQLTLRHEFQLGDSTPEINLTPSLKATIRANTTAGSDLFEDDPFDVGSIVPNNTGYVAVALAGSLSLGLSGSSGDLTFGFDANHTVGLEYWKAFPLGSAEPTLGEAAGKTISGFVIPAAVDDLELLGLNDVCTASGQGTLTISAGFNVSATPNPLASVDLPLIAGKLEVQAGVMAGITASFAISGSYQIRARRTASDTIELSFCKQRGTTLTVDLAASGGVAVNARDGDLLASLLDAISTDPNDRATLELFQEGGLSADEIETLTDGIKQGLDHSLQASLDVALTQLADHQAAFQYEIRPAQLETAGRGALQRALKGDLSGLTALETATAGPVLAPGVKLINSVLSTMRKRETSLKVNLLGLVNFISIADLVRKCVVVRDVGSGDLTIADSATGTLLNAETLPERRRHALHKAMFESVMLTATYRVANAVSMTGLTSSNLHFVFNDSTTRAMLTDYLNWFAVMNLLTRPQVDDCLKHFVGGGRSTCLLRTKFDDAACRSMFFQSPGQLWGRDHYLDIGRAAMKALINPNDSESNRFRYDLLDQHWARALQIGPNDNLGPLMGLSLTDPRQLNITRLLRSDIYTIDWWATAMQTAGNAILNMPHYLAETGSGTTGDNAEFVARRARMQKAMAEVMRNSQTQFNEPWGLVAMCWASGSRGASARLAAKELLVVRP